MRNAWPAVASLAAATLVVTAIAAGPGHPAPVGEVDFLRDVRPILAEHCLVCHGPDEAEGGLRLDRRAGALADLGGYAAVVPGDREASELWYRITTDDARDRMPPEDHGAALDARQRAILGAWIDAGAPWQEHWGFAPASNPAPPPVRDTAWPQDPLDRFVLAALEAEGLRPAPAADDLTWLRRASFDLVGLPPTPAEIDAFLALPPDTRRARTVDRLLASPHFGETWARHLLDLVRYAETRGHEFDYPIPNAWEYRDYLVRALNDDIGWDQLIREHLAGDLLPAPRLGPDGEHESVLGTAFWWLGEALHSPVDLEVDLADRTANQLDVFGKAFLGLTLACARCHDHKFDPVPMRDYYALAGVVQSASYRLVRYQALAHNRALRAQLRALEADGGAAAEDQATRRLGEALARIPDLRRQAGILRDRITAARRERVLADFETGLPAAWQAEGAAFEQGVWSQATRPARYPDPQPAGDGFVNSQLLAADDGGSADRATGVLRSSPFVIDRDALLFRVGGGRHPGEVGVRLLVDGEEVRAACGDNAPRMRPVAWDLRAWRGRTARIEIFDTATGGWGHVTCDDFRLQDRVDERTLAASLLDEAAADPADPTAIARLLAWAQDPELPDRRDLDDLAGLVPQRAEAPPIADAGTVHWRAADAWWQDGASFVDDAGGPVVRGPQGELVGWLPFPAVSTDPDWTGLAHDPISIDEATQVNWRGSGRSFRTGTVRLGGGPVWYLVRGRGVAFAPVEHHRILNGPLHTGTALRFDTGGRWRWIRHDALTRYAGLRAHFEFSATDDTQWLGVAAVVEGAEQPPGAAAGPDALAALLTRPGLLPAAAARDAEAEHLARRTALVDQRRTVSRVAPALLDGNGVDQPLLQRGDPGAPGEAVPRATLSRFPAGDGPGLASHLPDGTPTSGRLELAERLLDGCGPLLARVFVNRVWHHAFGRGLAPQPDNFGVLAGYPTHPRLLDALASEFRAEGWQLKPLLRRIVLSSTYGQSGATDPKAVARDPANRLWHHRPPRRLTAEQVRDALLTVSGRLDRAAGGPSIPVHLTDFMQGRGRPSQSGPLDGAGRRTLYLEVRRNFPVPLLMTWDYPSPSTTMGRRSVSNVPAQALALMNGPLARELAEHWAAQEPGLEAMWWQAFGRAPRAAERAAARAYLAEAGVDRGDLAHALFNVKEFVWIP